MGNTLGGNVLGGCGGGGYTEGARVYNDANLLIPNAIATTLTFNQERYDTDDIHDVFINNSRLTCNTAGIYIIGSNIGWEQNVNNDRVVGIRLNGVTNISNNFVRATVILMTNQLANTVYELSVGDFVECRAYQNSGVVLNVRVLAQYTPEFWMQRIG